MKVQINNKRFQSENIERIKEKYNNISVMELMEDLSILYWDLEIQTSCQQIVSLPLLNNELELLLFKMKRYNALIKAGLRHYKKINVSCMIEDYKKCKLL